MVDSALITLTRGSNTTPALADLDGDGRPDLLLGSEHGGVQLWRNVTVGDAVRFVRDSSFVVPTDPYSAPAVGDVTADGLPKLIVGGIRGGAWWYAQPRR